MDRDSTIASVRYIDSCRDVNKVTNRQNKGTARHNVAVLHSFANLNSVAYGPRACNSIEPPFWIVGNIGGWRDRVPVPYLIQMASQQDKFYCSSSQSNLFEHPSGQIDVLLQLRDYLFSTRNPPRQGVMNHLAYIPYTLLHGTPGFFKPPRFECYKLSGFDSVMRSTNRECRINYCYFRQHIDAPIPTSEC